MSAKDPDTDNAAASTVNDGDIAAVSNQTSPQKLSSFGLPLLYSKVIITLDNNLLPAEKLTCAPSLNDGLDLDTERWLRFFGCELIQAASILLRLPQVAAATAQLLYQRFYYAKSFVRCDYEQVAMACLCLASKVEESPRKLRDIINVFNQLKFLRQRRKPHPLILDQFYVSLKNQIKKHERRVLKELGFCIHIKHPHKLIVTYMKMLSLLDDDTESSKCPKLLQKAWNYMNDGLRTDIFLRYVPETVACACIYLAARVYKVPLPISWWEVFDSNEADLIDISKTLVQLYNSKQPSRSGTELVVAELRKRILEDSKSQSKAHEGSGGENTPGASQQTKFSPSQHQSSKQSSPAKKEVQEVGERRATSRDLAKSRNYRNERSKTRSSSVSPRRSKKYHYDRRQNSSKDSRKHSKRSPSGSPGRKPRKHRKREPASRSRSRSASKDRHRRHQRERELEVKETLKRRQQSPSGDRKAYKQRRV